jgi:hypothetical protein
MFKHKMQQFVRSAARITAVSLLAGGGLVGSYSLLKSAAQSAVSDKLQVIKDELTSYQERERLAAQRIEDLKKLEMHIVKSVKISGARLSDLQTANIVSILSKVAMAEFSNFEQRELWIAVIANESKFNPKAKSHAGAIGIGQVMPGSAKWYGEKCGIEDVEEGDLYDIRINALVSACIFREILKSVDGSPSLSLVAYNAGQFSKDVKNIDKLTSINTESANYVAKITRFLEKTRAVNILDK